MKENTRMCIIGEVLRHTEEQVRPPYAWPVITEIQIEANKEALSLKTPPHNTALPKLVGLQAKLTYFDTPEGALLTDIAMPARYPGCDAEKTIFEHEYHFPLKIGRLARFEPKDDEDMTRLLCGSCGYFAPNRVDAHGIPDTCRHPKGEQMCSNGHASSLACPNKTIIGLDKAEPGYDRTIILKGRQFGQTRRTMDMIEQSITTPQIVESLSDLDVSTKDMLGGVRVSKGSLTLELMRDKDSRVFWDGAPVLYFKTKLDAATCFRAVCAAKYIGD